jgi:hypothetical protein
MRSKKTRQVLVPVVLAPETMRGLKLLSKLRKRSVDDLASSIIRQYARGRLVHV